MTVDPGFFYRAARERIINLVSARGVDTDRRVPATPAWTVKDVLAHVAGVARDGVTGNLDGVTTDPWTAAQVERARDLTVAQLVEQWQADGPFLDAVFAGAVDGIPARGVIDVLTHEADIRNALGLPFSIPADALGWAAGVMRRDFHAAVADQRLPDVDLDATDAQWLRGRLGRFTTDEARQLKWSADPDPYLDTFFVFGRAEVSLGEYIR
jgi:uncharacterized protein (TIGR03083 family)